MNCGGKQSGISIIGLLNVAHAAGLDISDMRSHEILKWINPYGKLSV